MDWKLSSEAEADSGAALESFLQELDGVFRPSDDTEPLRGFTFLYDARRMLDVSREIERDIGESADGAELYVGFQNAEKFEAELPRYRSLKAAGAEVYAFGEGQAPSGSDDAATQWTPLAQDHLLLENQWYLVAMRPSPVAFVGWEISDAALWGRHGATHPDKSFIGFVSDDLRAAQAIIEHLQDVRTAARREVPTTTATDSDPLARVVSERGLKSILLFADDGKRAFLERSLDAVQASLASAALDVYVYDLASASYLVDPYKWEDDRRPLTADYVERVLNRSYLAETVRRLAGSTKSARALLAPGVGFSQLGGWVEKQLFDAVLVPAEFDKPGFLDRIGGFTTKELQRLGVTTIVEEPNGELRVLSGSG
jgi:hypothetical protein